MGQTVRRSIQPQDIHERISTPTPPPVVEPEFDPRGKTYRIMCQVDNDKPFYMFSGIDATRNFDMRLRPPIPGESNVYFTMLDRETNKTIRLYGEIE